MNEDRALIVDVGVSVVLQVDASRYRTEQIDDFDDDGLQSRQEERRRQHRDSRDRIVLILSQAGSEDETESADEDQPQLAADALVGPEQ